MVGHSSLPDLQARGPRQAVNPAYLAGRPRQAVCPAYLAGHPTLHMPSAGDLTTRSGVKPVTHAKTKQCSRLGSIK